MIETTAGEVAEEITRRGISSTQKLLLTIEPGESETALDARAEADIAAGRVVPHSVVRVWLSELAGGTVNTFAR